MLLFSFCTPVFVVDYDAKTSTIRVVFGLFLSTPQPIEVRPPQPLPLEEFPLRVTIFLLGLIIASWPVWASFGFNAASAQAPSSELGHLPQSGHWVQLPAGVNLAQGLDPALELPVVVPEMGGGGVLWYQLEFSLEKRRSLVIDFASSSVLDQFQHYLIDHRGRTLMTLTGGIAQGQNYEFFLRHGRQFELPAGHYRLLTRLESPFFLALPRPKIYPEADYRQQISSSQALTLVGLGIFLALAFYYLVMGLWRKAGTDLLYALFIVGNLLYNGAAQLVFSHLWGLNWFYLISTPILFSNVIYIGFVMRLLGIGRRNHPWLFRLGLGAILLLASFWPLALIWPNWSLEFCRLGVAVFALYGLCAGAVLSFKDHKVARLYLFANAAFAVPALFAISLKNLPNTILTIEHLGMIAVLIEVLLLAQVISYQIAQVYRERSKSRAAIDQALLLSNLTAQAPGVTYQLRMNAAGDLELPFVSRRIAELFEISAEDAQADISYLLARIHPEDTPRIMASIAQSARSLQPWQEQFRVILPERGLRWLEGMAQLELQEDSSILWYGFVSEITERKQVEEQIRHMAQHDSLTNLPNRALFNDRLEHALKSARRHNKSLALMFIDLDGFKNINDREGHALGDLLLQQVAKILTINLRAADTVARIGGDEFVALLETIHDLKEALAVAEKICAACAQPIQIGDRSFAVSTSIGLAVYPDHGQDAKTLIRCADEAMYSAKTGGRNQVKIYQSTALES